MTFKEAFNTLDEPYRSQAIKNAGYWQLYFTVKSRENKIAASIAEAFVWHETEQGHGYWKALYYHLLIQNL